MRPPISFVVQGIPKGQPRPRAFVRNGLVRMYDPGTAEGWKNCIAQAWQNLAKPEPFSGAVALDCQFCMPRPKAHYKKGALRKAAPFYCSTKPDLDNLLKAVEDCLTQLNAWRDDSQVVNTTARKVYSHTPGCHITISELG